MRAPLPIRIFSVLLKVPEAGVKVLMCPFESAPEDMAFAFTVPTDFCKVIFKEVKEPWHWR